MGGKANGFAQKLNFARIPQSELDHYNLDSVGIFKLFLEPAIYYTAFTLKSCGFTEWAERRSCSDSFANSVHSNRVS